MRAVHPGKVMGRTIGAVAHGIIDYAVVLILAVGPGVAGFRGRQATICYAVAVVIFLLAVITRYPLGAAKALPFPLHGAVEAFVAVLLIILPWLAGFSAGVNSRNFFVAVGVILAIVAALTDFRNVRGRAAPAAPAARP